jgi:hypothetical protein
MPMKEDRTRPEGIVEWEPERAEEHWSDRDAWRGESYNDDLEAWRGAAGAEMVAAWDPRDAGEMATWDDSADEGEKDAGWPEFLAGPEYWMYKRLTD